MECGGLTPLFFSAPSYGVPRLDAALPFQRPARKLPPYGQLAARPNAPSAPLFSSALLACAFLMSRPLSWRRLPSRTQARRSLGGCFDFGVRRPGAAFFFGGLA